jgi:hypothetical protein
VSTIRNRGVSTRSNPEKHWRVMRTTAPTVSSRSNGTAIETIHPPSQVCRTTGAPPRPGAGGPPRPPIVKGVHP